MAASNGMNLSEGTIIADKYRIERVLGQGGMGIVVVAMHLHLEERVAIKFLHSEVADNGEAVARFIREAQIAAKIKSAHVARVIDVAMLPDRTPYLVMEYLVGGDLGQRVQKRGPLESAEVAAFMLEVCEALAEAHALGIVHRDIKPANLFVAELADGTQCVKILDFGISKISKGASSGMTRTTAVMGSPNYMSPEQLKSARDVDARTDIWALGVTMFEMLTGRLPFEAEDMPQLCTMILYSEPQGLRDLRPALTPEWQAVTSRCLAKERDQRYANVAELAHDLAALSPVDSRRSLERIARFLGPVPSRQFAPPPSVQQMPAQVTGATWGKTQDPAPRSKGPLWAVAGAAVVALAIGVWILVRPEAPPPAPEAQASATIASAAPLSTPAAPTPAPPPAVAPELVPTAAPVATETAPVASAQPVAATPKVRAQAPARPKPAAAAPAPQPVAPAPVRRPAALPDGLD